MWISAGIAVGLGQTDAILSRFLIDISGTKVLRVMQISWRNLQLGELNCDLAQRARVSIMD